MTPVQEIKVKEFSKISTEPKGKTVPVKIVPNSTTLKQHQQNKSNNKIRQPTILCQYRESMSDNYNT